jgi:RNA polymerase sigma-70 factor (ECF subfamily)
VSTAVQHDRAAEEAWLIARIGAGDREAFRELYARYSGPLHALTLRMAGESRDAEELLQDVFLKIWRSAPAYDAGRARPFTWAVMIARRTCIDALRRRGGARRDVPVDAAGARADEAAVTPADATMVGDDVARIRAALGAFPAEQRAALDLALFGGLAQAEIADRLQQPLGTVKSWIRRGLQELRNATTGE